MTLQWLYEGSLDTVRRVLTLDAEGPSFSGDGSMVKYQDIIEVVDADTYLFSSQFQSSDGNLGKIHEWQAFTKKVALRQPLKMG